VILCPGGADAPSVLLAALRKRAVEPVLTRDPFAAMLAIMRLAPGASADDAAPGEGQWPPALIVVEPARAEDAALEDLLDAAPRRAPGLVVWQYDEHARPPLRALLRRKAAQPPANDAPAVVVPPKGRRPATPTLRLTGEPAPNDHFGRAEPATEPDPPENLLSDEELSMLLADDLNEPDAR
jgi:hypothetical protein